jgi:hypothetical protein
MTAINIVDRRTPGTPEMINDEITGGEAFGKPALELVHEQLAGSVEPFTLPDDPDADVIADLAAIGIDFSGSVLTDLELAADQAKREAVAATFLDHASRHATRADELAQARDHQLAILLAKGQRIRDFYEREIQKQNARRDELLRYVEHLASLSVYTARRSRSTRRSARSASRTSRRARSWSTRPRRSRGRRACTRSYVQVTAKLGAQRRRRVSDGRRARRV